jgi:2-polyprenyl-3-methyl-5-hydroxy-6-metoxy-1,4-benzoquinol methylase
MKSKLLTNPSETRCPTCGSKHLKVFLEITNVPVLCNILWASLDAARHCLRGDIQLAFCPLCSHITNIAFDPNRVEYTQAYENSLDYSPRFQTYARSLAKRLIKRYKLYNKDIIEIGCGKGNFLIMLCKLGNNRGVGFDPTFVEREGENKIKDRVKFVQDFYSEKYANYRGDLIVCRQTLEHVQNPQDFLKMLRHAVDSSLNTPVFFEVPNALQIFHKLFLWDIIYEHCSYFTPISLSRILLSSKFHVCELAEDFEGQFLCVHALASNRTAPDFKHGQIAEVNRIARFIASFATKYKLKVEMWRRKLEQIENKKQRAVVWGTGSKGVTFLNTFKNSHIEYAVDINPLKHRKYIAGTGQQIMPPYFLRDYQPDVIIVMNPIYKREIRQITKELGISPKFMYA